MTRELILLFFSLHPGATITQMTKTMRVNTESAYSTITKLTRDGVLRSTSHRPRGYTLETSTGVTNDMYDEYVHRIIAAGASTVEDVVMMSGLSAYRTALSIRRLKNLNKISTTTGKGITLNLLPEDSKIRHWTTKEMRLLEEFAGVLPASEICERLGRTPRSIQMKCHLLGLSLVTHTCKRGHKMVERKTGKWVCNECHSEAERLKRVGNKA